MSARFDHPQKSAGEPSPKVSQKRPDETGKLGKRLRSQVGKAIADFNLIEAGDRVMVCLSGGKDSYVLLDVLQSLQRAAPIDFELIAVHLDQKQPGYPQQVLPGYLEELGLPYHILEQDTFSLVQSLTREGKTTCSVCSRLRRGILYACAGRIGATKIALGHHLDDVVETLFLNMFFGGRLKAMPPKLRSDDGQNMVIRPLYYCREQDLARWAAHRRFPIIPCNLCGSQENLQRQVVKEMLQRWDQETPGRVRNIARSLSRVVPSHLSDRELFDFVGLQRDRDQLPLLDLRVR